MANRCSNLARAGLPEGSKVATATAEVLRRMKNVSRELPHDELDKVLLEYMTELRHGGYPHSFRANVLQSAAAGYAKMWKLEASGSGHVNRPKHVTQSKRRAMRLAGNQTWYDGSRRCQTEKPKTKPVQRLPKPQQKSVNQPTESVLFLPYTPQSRLKKKIQDLEKELNGNRKTGKVRIVERAGPTVMDLIGNKSSWTKRALWTPPVPPLQNHPWLLQGHQSCFPDHLFGMLKN